MKSIIVLLTIVLCYTFSFGQKKETSNNWTTISQDITVETKKERKYKLTGYVKAIETDTVSRGFFYSLVRLKNNEWGPYQTTLNTPVTHLNWIEHNLEGTINEESSSLSIGMLLSGDGDFKFDNISLLIEDDNGEMQPFPIGNSGFEKLISNENVHSWYEGFSDTKGKSVKEYTITSSTDAQEGSRSLHLIGTGTDPDLHISKIEIEEEYAPQLGVLMSMLDQLKKRVENKVSSMTTYEIDHLHDEEANRIGALVMHLAAAEVLYQVRSFENRPFNEEEEAKWGNALSLGKKAREEFKGKPIEYYLEEYTKVRARTKELFKTVDEAWLQEMIPEFGMNKYYGWFHVMEHQSSHLGQILFLSKRIPPEPEINAPEQLKN